jgi:putative transposase
MPVDAIVDIGPLVSQAWKEDALPALRASVTHRLEKTRAALIEGARRAGRVAYRWGYLVRKSLQTPHGDLGPVRIPRVRIDGREARLMPRQVRRVARLDALIAQTSVAGVSQRRLGPVVLEATGQSLSAATVGRVLCAEGEALLRRRTEPLTDTHAALALDGVWARYRSRGEAVAMLAVGIDRAGRFYPLDWETGTSESAALCERLLGRLEARGVKRLQVITADGNPAVRAAAATVYPHADLQHCLWHLQRSLQRYVPGGETVRRRFRRDFWEVYNGLDLDEVRQRKRPFDRHWRPIAPTVTDALDAAWDDTLHWLRFPARWRHRARTVNLAEGYFRHFRRFLGRFPGLNGERHFARTLAVYQLMARAGP